MAEKQTVPATYAAPAKTMSPVYEPPLLCRICPAMGTPTNVAAARKAKHDGKQNNGGHAIPGRQPDGKHGRNAQQISQNHGVEAAEAVGQDAGQPAAGKGTGVEKHNHEIGQLAARAVRERIRRHVLEADEEAPFDKEDARRHEQHRQAQQHAQVRQKAPTGRAGRVRKHVAASHRHAAHEQQHHRHRANHARRPREAEPLAEVRKQQRKGDAAEATARHGEPRGRGAAPAVILANGRDGHDKDNRGCDAGHDADDEDKVPVRAAEAEGGKGGGVEQQRGGQEAPRAAGVKDGADLQAAKEDGKVVEAKDPGDAAGAVRGGGGELMA
ncbi:hypothetical protein BBAD15_g1336 [Beauveria bassiana D1-5]|uniref:Uncharacterized protein n=1 Tax=Beauveria bassiana D1-5 TaxID=1245745 RepID=A0A0A2VYA7_BEABA|nr:hypothetical protein BBAD15_g1336 [Beauveria bassiana D1-5]